MDGEQLLVNVGAILGFVAFMAFWIGIAMWLRVDADKRGMIGWVWAFLGILAGPLALFAYLIFRGNRPILDIVKERDALIEETIRTGLASDYFPPVQEAKKSGTNLSPDIQAALEAENRRY